MAAQEPPRYVPLNEGAEYLGVHPKTLRRQIAAGRLTGYRMTGTRIIRVELNELEALLRPMPNASSTAA